MCKSIGVKSFIRVASVVGRFGENLFHPLMPSFSSLPFSEYRPRPSYQMEELWIDLAPIIDEIRNVQVAQTTLESAPCLQGFHRVVLTDAVAYLPFHAPSAEGAESRAVAVDHRAKTLKAFLRTVQDAPCGFYPLVKLCLRLIAECPRCGVQCFASVSVSAT